MTNPTARWESYHLPATLEDALGLLEHYAGRARVVGGGTDYFVDAGAGEAARPQALVDVTRIAGWREIGEQDGWIVIGCGATHARIVQSAAVQRHGTALAEACGQIGGPQVRNVATLAGNIAHALPAADGTLALLALDGEALIASSPDRREWRPLAGLFRGPGVSAIDSTRQVLAAVRFRPTGAGEGSAFARVMRPQGVALPILGLAARVTVVEGVIARARIALGPVAPVPCLAEHAMAALAGRPAAAESIAAAVPALLDECRPRTSAHRATAEYRREILPFLLREAVLAALRRATQRSEE